MKSHTKFTINGEASKLNHKNAPISGEGRFAKLSRDSYALYFCIVHFRVYGTYLNVVIEKGPSAVLQTYTTHPLYYMTPKPN